MFVVFTRKENSPDVDRAWHRRATHTLDRECGRRCPLARARQLRSFGHVAETFLQFFELAGFGFAFDTPFQQFDFVGLLFAWLG